jgi:RNA polymerase sigma-70 factor (ECF subfamily)
MVGPQALFAKDVPIALGGGARVTPWVASQGARLRRYFSRRAPADDVDDLVQDVFLRLQSARPREPVANMEAYLITIARHVLASRRRGLAMRCCALHDALEDVPEPASDLSPERIVAARQDWARAMSAVRDLPPRARAAFQLYHFEEMTYSAIAEHMQISRDSVKELLRRAASRVCESPKIEKNSPNPHDPIPPAVNLERLYDGGLCRSATRRKSRQTTKDETP